MAEKAAFDEPNTSPLRWLFEGRSSITAVTRIGWPSTWRTPPIGASRPKYLRAPLRERTTASGASSAVAGSPATAGTGMTLKTSGSAQMKFCSPTLMSPRRTAGGKPVPISRAVYWIWGKSSFSWSARSAVVVSSLIGWSMAPVILRLTR